MILLNQFLKITQYISLAVALFLLPPVYAQEWSSTFEERNGFSEFTPPNFETDHEHRHEYKKHKEHKQHWRSGSSFNNENMFSYSKPHEDKYSENYSFSKRRNYHASYNNSKRTNIRHVNRNPWKPIKSRYGKQAFSSNRPWGKLPEQKPLKRNNMRLHDLRFKRWINQQNNNTYQPQAIMAYSAFNYGINPLHVPAGYAYSNSVQNGALINSALINSRPYSNYQSPGGFVPFTANNPGYYQFGNGYHPVNYNPYTFANNQAWGR